MTAHHFTLEHIARSLHSMLATSRVSACWSQEKFTAAFIFEGGLHHDRSILIDVSSGGGSILERPSMRRAHRNSRDTFPDLFGQTLAVIAKQQDDRVISFVFDRHVLHVELFSAGKGNIVLTLDGRVVDTLHDRASRLGSVYTIKPKVAHEPLSNLDSTVVSDLSSSNLRLGRYYSEEICHRCGIEPLSIVESLNQEQRTAILRAATALIDECLFHPRFLILARGDERLLSLTTLRGWSVVEEDNDVLEAVRRTKALRHEHQTFTDDRRKRLRTLDGQIRRTERTLAAVIADDQATHRPAIYRSWADTIMSQQDLHRQGLSELSVVNVVTLQPDVIDLRSDRTLLDNATTYYQKARTAEAAARSREVRLPALRKQLDVLRQERDIVLAATSMNELPKPRTPMSQDHETRPSSTSSVTYRVFQIDEDHILYVGRSAANNDELTMKFARQNDWWMHVRGASGSHAVLRGVTGPKIPKHVLEVAAAITAYYSQARNASYVPVVYTQRKFVRKPKGANVGAVTLEREQTVMVRPGLPGGGFSEE